MINDAQKYLYPATKALIVEDVAALRILLRVTMERGHVEVREAESLAAARHALREGFRPDIVLLDLELGDGLGLDLIQELPESTTVHILTANLTEETQLRCTQAGCASTVEKSRDLCGFVDSLIHQRTQPLASRRTRNDGQMDRRYLEFLAESRTKLRAHDTNQSPRTLSQLAHRICGTAVHFGYPGLGSSAQQLNCALREQKTQSIKRALTVLDQRIGEALEAFHFRQQMNTQQEQKS